MTDDKKHDDKDRKKLSDEELKDVAGGIRSHQFHADLRADFNDIKKADTHSEDSGDTTVSGEL
ncbi:MAG: hypothetical protein AAEJ46_02060 [Planctomycetota bacterium]|jgi:hypothetical protein